MIRLQDGRLQIQPQRQKTHCINLSTTSSFSRYVLECQECGVIYRSRQYWYGNTDPEKTVVRTHLKHVWEGVSKVCK